MEIELTPIPDLYLIKPRVHEDERGFFYESYHHTNYFGYNFVQDNVSKSAKNIIRGLHFQTGDFAQAKLVQVIHGIVLDVVIDLRPKSPTFEQSCFAILSDENKKQFLIPRGFAHGFAVLSDYAIFHYKCDNYYSKEHEGGINPFDPYFNIDWEIPMEHAILSEKDKNWPSYAI